MLHPDHAYPKCKHSHITCSAFVQLPLYVDGIDSIIDTQMLKTPHGLLVQLASLDYWRNPDIGTLKK